VERGSVLPQPAVLSAIPSDEQKSRLVSRWAARVAQGTLVMPPSPSSIGACQSQVAKRIHSGVG
jgi:hypothetical protein